MTRRTPAHVAAQRRYQARQRALKQLMARKGWRLDISGGWWVPVEQR